MKPMLQAKGNEILDENGKQLAVVLPSNAPKADAKRWAQFIVDRENSIRRALNLKEESPNNGT